MPLSNRRFVPLLVVLCVGCSSSSSSTKSEANAADASFASSGNVWVDSKGVVLGKSIEILDLSGNNVMGLVDSANVIWQANSTSINTADGVGTWYYDGANCTGTRYLGGSEDNGVYGVPRPSYSTTVAYVDENGNGMFAVKSTAVSQQLNFMSWEDPTYGCQIPSVGQSSLGYTVDDIVAVTPPQGTPPFHIETQ